MPSLINEKTNRPMGIATNIGWMGCFPMLAGLVITASLQLGVSVLVKRYGFRSSDALPLFISKGTELWVCVTIHLPSILRKQTVARHRISIFSPSVFVPRTPLRL